MVDGMGDLSVRPYLPADAGAVSELWNAIQAAAGGRGGWTAARIAALAGALVADFETDTRLLVTPEDRPVAVALVCAPPPGGAQVDVVGGVHPRRRGQGLGRELLAWQCARAAEIRAARGGREPWHLEANALSPDSSARRLFERSGFDAVRYVFSMAAPTAGAHDAALPDGIRTATPGEDIAPALYEAHTEAFADHWGWQRREYEQWLALTLRRDEFRRDLSRVAFDGEEIAGEVLSYTDGDPERISIGQVATRRPWRGRGVASALLAEVLTAARAAGFSQASLSVDADSPTGAVGVYERAGFVEERSFVIYRSPVG
jgi:mycothiol synthase